MLLSGNAAPCWFDLVLPFFVFVWFAEKFNEMIVYLFIITLKQFCSKIGNELIQDNTDQVVDEKAEDLKNPSDLLDFIMETPHILLAVLTHIE